MIKYNDIDTPVSLTCCYRSQYIVINKYEVTLDDGHSEEVVEYFVPVFFKTRENRRNISMIRHYNLENLYNENHGIIGYYEINTQILDLSKEESRTVNIHNQNLFNMALAKHTMAVAVMDLSKDDDCYFTFLPIELLHMIMKLVLKMK